jgi:DNA repair protein RecO (recombination protein O)
MSQILQSTQGVVLKVIPFRDYDQILFLFTPDIGLTKLFYKGGRRKSQAGRGPGIPLTQVEVIYRETNGEMLSCYEVNCLDSFSFLRKELIFLEVACDLLQIILTSQLVGKAAPQLYHLLYFYLKKIPQTAHPWALATSFRLKLLKHDGLIFFPLICCECHQILQNEAFIRASEGWCVKHRPNETQIWNIEELEMLYLLANCQSHREICECEISSLLQNKVVNFFDACIGK